MTVETWPLNEISTRNCLFCKVMTTHHKKFNIRAYCELGKPLSKQKRIMDPSYSMPLKDVLKCPTFFHSSCSKCRSFEHDN